MSCSGTYSLAHSVNLGKDFAMNKRPKSGTTLEGTWESMVYEKLVGGEKPIIHLSTIGNPVIRNMSHKKMLKSL